MAGVTNFVMDRLWQEILAAPDTVSLQAIGSPIELVVSAAAPALTVASFYLDPKEGVRTFAAGDNLWARGAVGAKLRIATDLTEGGSAGSGGGGDASEAEQQAQTTELQAVNTKLALIDDLVDGLEGLLTAIDGRVDGLEALLTTQAGYLDGLETAVALTNTKLTSALASGSSVSANFTPAAAAYLGGDIIEGAKEFVALGPSGACLRILGAELLVEHTAIISGETSYRLHLYNVTPPSAPADNAAWDLPSGDRASYLGYVDLGAPQDPGSTLYIRSIGIDVDIKLSGTSAFGLLVTNGPFTATAAIRKVTLHTTIRSQA